MHLIVTCPEETKSALIAELQALGATDLMPAYRAVHCQADEATFYALHLKLRTASRILREIKNVASETQEMLFSQAKRVPWPDLFSPDYGYLIEGVPAERGPSFMRANDISKKVREGLQDSFSKRGKVPKVDLEEPKVIVVAYVEKGRCLLSFDTCGKALHKRGYRGDGHPAPVKETLAASILQMVGYTGEEPFLDPFCGSGTIAIEAAMIALKKAPQIHRKKGQFAFEWLRSFDRDLWRTTQDQIRAERLPEPPFPVCASDISDKYVEMARASALKARVERDIRFDVKSFLDVEPPADHGLLVANLPYGERLQKDEKDQLADFYKSIGDKLKKSFTGWRAALLVAEDSPHKVIGLKTSQRIPLKNGSIPCKLLVYELYQGSKKPKAQPDA